MPVLDWNAIGGLWGDAKTPYQSDVNKRVFLPQGEVWLVVTIRFYGVVIPIHPYAGAEALWINTFAGGTEMEIQRDIAVSYWWIAQRIA